MGSRPPEMVAIFGRRDVGAFYCHVARCCGAGRGADASAGGSGHFGGVAGGVGFYGSGGSDNACAGAGGASLRGHSGGSGGDDGCAGGAAMPVVAVTQAPVLVVTAVAGAGRWSTGNALQPSPASARSGVAPGRSGFRPGQPTMLEQAGLIQTPGPWPRSLRRHLLEP